MLLVTVTKFGILNSASPIYKKDSMYKSVGPLFSFLENCEGPLVLIDRKELFLVSEKGYYIRQTAIECSVRFDCRRFQWRIQRRGPGNLPPLSRPYFWTKLRPEGPKNKFLEAGPPLILASGWPPPPPAYPLISRSGSGAGSYRDFIWKVYFNFGDEKYVNEGLGMFSRIECFGLFSYCILKFWFVGDSCI